MVLIDFLAGAGAEEGAVEDERQALANREANDLIISSRRFDGVVDPIGIGAGFCLVLVFSAGSPAI